MRPDPFVPSARALCVQCVWGAILLWPVTLGVCVVLARLVQ